MNTQPMRGDLIVLAMPVVLWVVMGIVFNISTRRFGKEAGYLLGFAFYWLFFGLVYPALWMDGNNFVNLLEDRTPLFSLPNWSAALLWVIVTAVTLVMYGKSFIRAPLTLVLLAIPLATINGFCEEILWRGMFVQAFPGNPWLGILYPAVGFALWHLIPQSVFPAPNIPGFILSTFFLGLAYGFIAYSTGSAFWAAVSHSLGGILALSGMLAPSVLRLFSK